MGKDVPQARTMLGNDAISAFGAEVSIGDDCRTLCLVIGRGLLERDVAEVGGRPVAHFGAGRLLAVIGLAQLPLLQCRPNIRAAAPVSIDPGRFSRFAEFAFPSENEVQPNEGD